MDAASPLLPGTGHCSKQSSAIPALVPITSLVFPPSYLYIFFQNIAINTLHILALLGHFIEDHPILVDALFEGYQARASRR